MNKKAAAAGRVDCAYKETIDCNGNPQYVFDLNMGIFEKIRHLLDKEFKMNPNVTKDFNGYKNRYNHTEIFRVKNSKGEPSFTVSLFLTTSRLQANGKNPQKCVDLLKNLSRRVNRKEAEFLNEMILQTKKDPVEEKKRRSNRNIRLTERAAVYQCQIKKKNIGEGILTLDAKYASMEIGDTISGETGDTISGGRVNEGDEATAQDVDDSQNNKDRTPGIEEAGGDANTECPVFFPWRYLSTKTPLCVTSAKSGFTSHVTHPYPKNYTSNISRMKR